MKANVLIVEDEPIIAADIELQLTRAGYRVTTVVGTGAEAIAAVLNRRPDVILMDIHLEEEMDGIEAAKIILKSVYVPIIFLTSNLDDLTFERARKVNPYAFLSKPFRIDDVTHSIDLAVGKEGGSDGDDFIELVKEYILKDINNDEFSIDYLCKKLNVSRSQLHRRIKEYSGESTSIFIRSVKLLYAKNLLLHSALSISEVAYNSGFDSPQNFTKYFVLEYNETPSQFRKTITTEVDLDDEIADQLTVTAVDENRARRTLGIPSTVLLWKLSIGIFIAFLVLFGYRKLQNSAAQLSDKEVRSDTPIKFESSIAILPFDALTADDLSIMMADGIVEDILTNLSHFKELKVISRTSSSLYDRTLLPISDIAKELNVAYILEGSIRKNNNEMIITAQLIRAIDNEHVWAKKYTVHDEDILRVQSEVSLLIAKELNQEISQKMMEVISNQSSSSLEAYSLFLMGKKLQEIRTQGALLESIEKFDQALDIDPTFSNALAYKANSYNLLTNIGYSLSPSLINRSEVFALEAIRLDPENGFAYATLGMSYKDQLKWDQANSMFKIALERNPNIALINYWYSLFLREMLQNESSVYYSARALELDPLYPVIFAGHVVNCLHAKKIDTAKDLLTRSKRLFSNSFLFYWAEAKYYEYTEEFGAAIGSYKKLLTLNSSLRQASRGIAYCQGRLGNIEYVNQYILSLSTDDPIDDYSRASSYASIGSNEDAIMYLVKAAEGGYLPGDLRTTPYFEGLNDDPRFQAVMEQLGNFTIEQ